MDPDAYRYVDGLWMHSFFHDDLIRSALSYKPRPDDIFLVTYPKCGTTWMQYLILSILSKGHPPKSVTDFMLASPFIEMMGAESVDRMPRPGPIKTHIPFHMLPYPEQAKYIYVARNPYDVCVSFYYYLKCFTPTRIEDVSFAKFHELFLSGKTPYGPYFDHLLSGYEHRNDANVLFFTYEAMKKEPKIWTVKIADFIDKKFGDELRDNETLLQAVLDASSLKNMQGIFNDHLQPEVSGLLSLPPERRIKSMEVYRENAFPKEQLHHDTGFVRKGLVGDWREHFTAEQIKKTKLWIHEQTKGSDVMRLWNDIDLP